MEREDELRETLTKDASTNSNTLLLKKYITCVHHGWFRINGLPPDESFNLVDYLLDDERVIIDFTRISEESRDKFLNWFLTPHMEHASQAYLSGVSTTDYRGYTAEVGLSWLGRVSNLLYFREKSYRWPLTATELSAKYQISGIKIYPGSQGLLVKLNQPQSGNTGLKYHASADNQNEPLRNTKRLLLTETMVNKLLSLDLESQDYVKMLNNPHSFSIKVNSKDSRRKAMSEYRDTQRLLNPSSWSQQFWQMFQSKPDKASNDSVELEDTPYGRKNYQFLFKTREISFYKRYNNGEILVIEKRPELDSIVYCGGGAKIYAHVGAKKAFEDAGLNSSKNAGSSAGAIMAILSYLGYNSDEILNFFQGFNQDNLIYYEIDSTGLSDARALKAALDYMIIKKVNEIIRKYQLDKTIEGRRYITDSILKHGKITFESLHLLKTRYPDCGLGEKIIVTATNVPRRQTRYLSYSTTPTMELSEAGKISASLPVVYKPTTIDGEIHNDGAILSSLPTEVFKDNLSTLLESEHGNCLSLVVFQFDNGCESSIVDKLTDRVYRENFFWNWVYGGLTGVKDPVSGWEKDRIKLLHHSNQVVLIPVDNVSATQFDIDRNTQNILVDNGYKAATNYINTRYQCEDGVVTNKEIMYSTFSSIDELLYFCCYRNRLDWFEEVAKVASAEGIDVERIQVLREQYFSVKPPQETTQPFSDIKTAPLSIDSSLFSSQLSAVMNKKKMIVNMRLFELIYPLFQKLSCTIIKDLPDLKSFKLARHSLSLNEPLACLQHLEEIAGETNVFLAIFIQILTNYQTGFEEEICLKLKLLMMILEDEEQLKNPAFYGDWDLLPRHSDRILRTLAKGKWSAAIKLCTSLKQGEEPLETFSKTGCEFKKGLDDDHTDNWSIEGDWPRFSS